MPEKQAVHYTAIYIYICWGFDKMAEILKRNSINEKFQFWFSWNDFSLWSNRQYINIG